jgi:ABC-type sugar transport system substrate-binding protein
VGYDDIRDPGRQDEAVRAIDGIVRGRLTRSQFVKRAAALGLSGGLVSSVLAACGSGSSSKGSGGGGSSGGAADATSLAALTKIVYPQGFTSDSGYTGPNGGSKVAFLPGDYHGAADAQGIWNWNFTEFKVKKNYRVALAHFSSKWDLMVESVERFKRFGEKAGFTVQAFDNNFDADQAIKNANVIAAQKFDFVIEEQEFPDANKTINTILKSAGIPVIYFAVEGPEGALFMDTGNFRMCSATGEWLGTYAKDNWGGKVDLVLMAAQPRAGKYVAEREVGYKAGIKKILPDLPDSVFVTYDSQGLLDESQKKAADILTSKSGVKNIIGCGTNDDAAVGIVRALEAAKLTANAAVGGQAGQASAVAELKKPSSAFKVSAFQDVEAQLWMAAIGILQAEGGTVAPVNFYPFYLTTSKNVSAFPPQAGTLTKA